MNCFSPTSWGTHTQEADLKGTEKKESGHWVIWCFGSLQVKVGDIMRSLEEGIWSLGDLVFWVTSS